MTRTFGHARPWRARGVVLIVSILAAQPAWGATLRVCPEGCAYKAIQPAIDAAAAGDLIRIGRGRFEGALAIAGKALRIEGEGPTRTLIDAGESDTDRSTWAPALRLDCTSAADIRISGVGISGGRTESDFDNDLPDYGAGVRNAGCTVVLFDSIITDNEHSVTRGTRRLKGGGAGIANLAGGTMTLRDVVVIGNRITGGAGTALGAGIYNEGRLVVVDSRLYGNTARSYFNAPEPSMEPSMEAPTSTADVVVPQSPPPVFLGQGGGLYNRGGVVTLRDSVVTGNLVEGFRAASSGGGLATSGGRLTVIGSTIARNSSAGGDPSLPSNSGQGGGIFADGRVLLRDVSVVRNVALTRGGGILVTGAGTLTLDQAEIQHNRASGPSPAGGGIMTLPGGSVTATDARIDHNRPDDCAGAFGC